ncbi:MAG: lysylphosphatidylglycerol synthase transmembrane domain-containing protein [Gaiellaceae bacterium]
MRQVSVRQRLVAIAVFVCLLAGAIVLVVWRGPKWHLVADAFSAVSWAWIAVAVFLNLLSVLARSLAWSAVIGQALPRPHPRFRSVFSAFGVGLFANVVLPGRIGELARVAVLTRRVEKRKGVWATLVGTVFAHRIFDLFPVLALIGYVLATARIPHWALTSLLAFLSVGLVLFGFALVIARRQHRVRLDGRGAVRRVIAMARFGLAVMHAPSAATAAVGFQTLGWLLQLFAVYTTTRAFGLDVPVPAAGLVLLLMNVATIFPLWPGNIGLVQAAVALPLVSYGVDYGTGFAFGIGLQAVEASVGVGVGAFFLAREGVSYAMLKGMPDASAIELEEQRADDTSERQDKQVGARA